MTQSRTTYLPKVDILTVFSLGMIATALNVGIHEGVHAIACVLTGSDLQACTSLAVLCEPANTVAHKLIDGASPIANLIIGAVLFLILRNRPTMGSLSWFFLWLLMIMNWLYGSGYFLFSGIAGIGDYATVIEGWEPAWLWRVLLVIIGLVLYMGLIIVSLHLFGTRVGGTEDEQIKRASKMAIWAYLGSIFIVLIAAVFSPAGFLSLPVTAGLAAVIFGLSPLLWMMQFFSAKMFLKQPGPPLEIIRSWPVVAAAGVAILIYGIWLGRGLFF